MALDKRPPLLPFAASLSHAVSHGQFALVLFAQCSWASCWTPPFSACRPSFFQPILTSCHSTWRNCSWHRFKSCSFGGRPDSVMFVATGVRYVESNSLTVQGIQGRCPSGARASRAAGRGEIVELRASSASAGWYLGTSRPFYWVPRTSHRSLACLTHLAFKEEHRARVASSCQRHNDIHGAGPSSDGNQIK